MPELPEVETARRQAERVLAGRILVHARCVADPIVLDGISPTRFARLLRGCMVQAVQRHGKYLWFELDRRPWPVMHFGMSGSFRIYRRPSHRPTYWKIEFQSEDGQYLAMRDPRRFGRVRLLDDPRQSPPIVGLGPDPLNDLPRTPVLVNLFAGRSAAIKALLLDQRLFPGVGNWIADEALYQAGIAPHRPAGLITRDEVARLRRKLQAILRKACAVDADKQRFPADWLFHVRWGRKQGTITRRGEKVEHQTVAGRTTAWVPQAQD